MLIPKPSFKKQKPFEKILIRGLIIILLLIIILIFYWFIVVRPTEEFISKDGEDRVGILIKQEIILSPLASCQNFADLKNIA